MSDKEDYKDLYKDPYLKACENLRNAEKRIADLEEQLELKGRVIELLDELKALRKRHT